MGSVMSPQEYADECQALMCEWVASLGNVPEKRTYKQNKRACYRRNCAQRTETMRIAFEAALAERLWVAV